MQTRSEVYWERDFQVTDGDLEALYAAILEDGRPRSLSEMVTLVMWRRYDQERQAILRQAAEGKLYRPREEYDVGQRLIFSALNYRMGTVVGTRPGHNPRYGDFTVLQVELEGSRKPREFAAALQVEHELNEVSDIGEAQEKLSPEKLYELFGHWAEPRVEAALQESDEFVSFRQQWFLGELLPEIHIGHMNIAEALIDESRTPLTTEEILTELGSPPGATTEASLCAVNRALSLDERIDEVSTSDEPLWYLLSLEPPAITQIPARLEPAYATEIGMLLHRESLDLIEEVGDEWDEVEGALVGGIKPMSSATFILTYPHRREGTMPINWKTATLFPQSHNDRVRVTFVDRRNREEFPIWAAPKQRYAAGLGDWYGKHSVPVGGLIELRRTDDPFVIEIGYTPQRRKGEWVRSLRAQDGMLTFEIQRRAYVCRYDKHILLDDGQDELIDQLWAEINEQKPSLFQILQDIVPELAKLNAQGMFHAKALYSAVNVLRRCGLAPVLAELARQACFDPVGDGNWVFDPSLVGESYESAEEAMERPLSKRTDFFKYQVFRYSGF